MKKSRKYLTVAEVGKLLKATQKTRHGTRDACFVLLCYRHGLRVSEACEMKLSQVDLDSKVIHVCRLKNGVSTTHPLLPDEVGVLKAWLAERDKMKVESDALFVSERGKPLDRRTAWKMIKKLGIEAGFLFEVHPHMLRHACGYALANRGIDTRLIQDYLGHRNIQHTVVYTATNHARFMGLW